MDGNPMLKIALGVALIYVLWGLPSYMMRVGSMWTQGVRTSETIIAAQQKLMGAAELRNELILVNAFGLVAHGGADLRCETQSFRPWQFICAFAPTPKTSATRVQFGVNVNGLSTIVEVSPLVPTDAQVPAPRQAVAPRAIK